ncbi:lysylphosphatidylglycerol synthase domain-containing protein [Pseudonocardia sp.]|uniref:lysylphosphatidylglycerol synthase domain-containing protein n=1 Tax=Pseudonocardia sp. TaxID=60912 RepID=UPI00262C2A9D|nr:lysylphosphatidylglycerol synthase domain-containing protein [Pseudonocardia sp.]
MIPPADEPNDEGPARPRRGLLFWTKIGFGVAVLVAATWLVVDSWDEISVALGSIGWLALAGSLPPAIGGVAAAMLAWRTLLADLGSKLSVSDAGRVYFTSQLGKYVPGSVWPFLAQIELGRELKVPRAVSFAVSILAIVLSLTVGAAVAAATLLVGPAEALRSFWWILLALPVLAAALHPAVTVGGVNLLLRALRRTPLTVRPSWSGTCRAALWQTLSWILLGLHCYVLVAAVGAAGPRVVALAIGAFALAFCAGVLFLPSPAGAGVREFALAAGLAGVLAVPQAIAVVLVSRFALMFVDAALAAGWWVGRTRGDRKVGSPS